MTWLEVSFRYGKPPGETEIRNFNHIREVYGIWRLSFSERERLITVEYDASRLTTDDVAALLRSAGVDVIEKLEPVAPIPRAEPERKAA